MALEIQSSLRGQCKTESEGQRERGCTVCTVGNRRSKSRREETERQSSELAVCYVEGSLKGEDSQEIQLKHF